MSKFTRMPNNVFKNAGVTLKQAQLLEYLFLFEETTVTYGDLAAHFRATNNVVGRLVSPLRKKGMVRREIVAPNASLFDAGHIEDPIACSDWDVVLGGEAWKLRRSFAAWDQWLTQKTALVSGELEKRKTARIDELMARIKEDLDKEAMETQAKHGA